MKHPTTKKKIFVYSHWKSFSSPILMGILHSEILIGKEIFSFEYHKEWLKSTPSCILDPDLQWFQGIQYLSDQKKSNFGIFLDSSPDRWGRLLMRRQEAALAKKESRAEKTLHETEYLLGVYDEFRMGGLRFKTAENENFLSDNQKNAIPPWSTIRNLEEISLKLENEDAVEDVDYLKWLALLMAPGSSLGGARPKAGVVDPLGNMWIAKFPSAHDQCDIGGWEMVAHELARQAGITVAHGVARKFSSRYHTYLTRRFDRTENQQRLHFASAMTLLGYTDGADHIDNVSYLELAEFIMRTSPFADQDLEELWRRIVFSISISNTDDHLRNHGFLLEKNGWRLSPAYDINPNETGVGLKLNISETSNALEIDLAMDVCEYFRVSKSTATMIIAQVQESVKNWRKTADAFSLSKNEQDLKKNAFKF